jgi:hypothetical protein
MSDDAQLIDTLGSMTVAQLGDCFGLSVAEIVKRCLDGKQMRIPTEVPPPSDGARWNVRTKEGRESFDLALIEAVSDLDDPRGSLARTIREKVGGGMSAAQTRQALKRIIMLKWIGFTGQAGATRYKVKAAGTKRLGG